MATEGQTAGHIKLTVGVGTGDASSSFGYLNTNLADPFGSVSKIPTWNLQGKPVAMEALYSASWVTYLLFMEKPHVDADTITVTIVEKGLTTTLIKTTQFLTFYIANTVVFNSSDVGKTFTIIFDPEPTGYV